MIKYIAVVIRMNSNELLSLLSLDGNTLDVETVIDLLFMEYKKKCNDRSIYEIRDFLPQNLIKLYYSSGSKHSNFKEIVSSFKEIYIDQESKVEGVHNILEIEGLGKVYDYIRSDEWKKCPNIYIILLINLKLFSMTPYPDAGGKLRNSNCYLLDSKIETTPYNYIDKEIASLYGEFDSLLKEGIRLGDNKYLSNEDKIIEYISKCLRLKVKLITIHPFSDGNGRTMRALVNLLFKIANLPPIYVKLSEKDEYLNSMNHAIINDDYGYINRFYYYKICDSIMELDINNRVNSNTNIKKLIK